MIPETNYIIGAICIAFVVFITAKGELSTYVGFLVPGPAAPVSTGANATGAGSISNLLNLGKVVGGLGLSG